MRVRGVGLDLDAVGNDLQHRRVPRASASSRSSNATARPSSSRRPKPLAPQGLDGGRRPVPEAGQPARARRPSHRSARVGSSSSSAETDRDSGARPACRIRAAGGSPPAAPAGGPRRVRPSREDRSPTSTAEGAAHAREQQAHVVVHLGDGADGGPRVADAVLLADRNRRRDAVDAVDVRLLHPLEELPGVGRQRLDVAPLPFGVDRVEGQRRLARPAHAGQRRPACPTGS